jgi:AraC family transcriptional regulator
VTKRGAYGQRLGDIFGLRRTRAFVTRTLRQSEMAVAHIKCDRADNGLTTPIPREDAFLITLQIRDRPKHELWLDDRVVRAGHLKPGAISIYDLRLNPIAYSVSPFQSLHFYLPRRALNTLADLEGMARVDAFNNNPGLGVEDPVIHALGASLLPAFQRPAEASRAFVDHITLATVAHVLKTYGAGGRPPLPFEGRLAPWQERRAKEMLSARFDGAISRWSRNAGCRPAPSRARFVRRPGRCHTDGCCSSASSTQNSFCASDHRPRSSRSRPSAVLPVYPT